MYALLSAHGAALVSAHSRQRPLPQDVRTASWSYLRFHHGARGRRGNYSEVELRALAARLREEHGDVYAYFNNDWEGFAVANALRLRELLLAGRPFSGRRTGVAPGGGARRDTTEGRQTMPPRGVKKGTKRARQYEHIKDSLVERGRSEDTAEAIAARTVNKERARAGEARESSPLSRKDISSGRRGGIRASRSAPRGRTKDQLYEEARRKDIPGRSRMSKAELETAVGR